MRRSAKRTRKKSIFLSAGALLALFWFGALILTVKDTFFSDRSSAMAQSQNTGRVVAPLDLSETRYRILDRHHKDLAVSFKMHSVYAKPLEISDTDKSVEFLSEILELDKNSLLRDLRAERSFVWLGRDLPEEKVEKIRNRGLPGIYITNEAHRYYPYHQSASHVVGFLKDGHGLAGVESYYDRILKMSEEEENLSGAIEVKGHVVLALDIEIQKFLERQIGIISAEVDAVSAIGIIMRPSTGAILAMSSLPTYDPNLFWDFSSEERRNMVVNESLYIGGLKRLFDLAEHYETEGRKSEDKGAVLGSIEALKRTLNSEIFPRIADKTPGYFSDGEKQKISTELHWPMDFKVSPLGNLKFEDRIGLSGRNSIDLPIVNNGNNSNPKSYPSDDKYHVINNGKQATAVSLAAAFSRIINSGESVAPHIAYGIIGPESGKMAKLRRQENDKLQLETTNKIRKFLAGFSLAKNGPVLVESFVESDEQPSQHKSVDSGAQTSEEDGLLQAEDPRYQSLLIGYAPTENPELVLLVAFNDAAVDLDKKSPMRKMAEKNFKRLLKLAGQEVKTEIQATDPSVYAKAYREWQQSQQVQKKRAQNGSNEELRVMPDLRGVSLRKALQIIQPLGLKVRISGSGTVVSQSPKHGEKINNELCVIKLKEGLA